MPVFMYSQKFCLFVSGWMDFLFSFREGSTYFFYLLLSCPGDDVISRTFTNPETNSKMATYLYQKRLGQTYSKYVCTYQFKEQ